MQDKREVSENPQRVSPRIPRGFHFRTLGYGFGKGFLVFTPGGCLFWVPADPGGVRFKLVSLWNFPEPYVNPPGSLG
jgi:hypothetical protein